MTRDRLTHHRNNLCQLPCIRGCGATATRTGADAHEAVCPLLPVTCAAAEFGCAWNGARRDKAAHTAACSLQAVLPALRLMSRRIVQLESDLTAEKGNNAQMTARVAQLEAQLGAAPVAAGADVSTRIGALETELAAEKAARVAGDAALHAELVKPLEWHTYGDAWFTQHGLSLGFGWVQLNPSDFPFRIAKDAHGMVHLSGIIMFGEVGPTILTMPGQQGAEEGKRQRENAVAFLLYPDAVPVLSVASHCLFCLLTQWGSVLPRSSTSPPTAEVAWANLSLIRKAT